MTAERIFVGREAELEQFKKVLEDPRGQAILVVGQAGMGKTWLINMMAKLAENHPKLKCGWVRYEVTPTESVDSTMALMIDNAFEAAQVVEGSSDSTPRRLQQWKALLNVLKIGDLGISLRRDSTRNTRDQFLQRLALISEQMPENGRAIFIIDPEKYMQEKSASAWRIVVKQLPEKIKFVFAQRPEDELATSYTFLALTNLVSIPSTSLCALAPADVQEMVRLVAESTSQPILTLLKYVERYKGHPYAIQAALEIVRKTNSAEQLPQDPTPEAITETQWDQICRAGAEAISLFEAYAILEVGVPDEVVEAVSGLKATARKRLQKDSYLRGLLREEGYGRRIYHSILADYILEQIGKDEKKEYHSRALEVYRKKLKEAAEKQTAPDALAAIRLPEHILAVQGSRAFFDAFVNDCMEPLLNLGLFDSATWQSERALRLAEPDSPAAAAVLGNLGLVYQTMGDLDKAEEMGNRSLKIAEDLGIREVAASQYGNLGLVYLTRGDLDKAEQMLKKSLEINEKLGRLEGMANQNGNLGVIYRKRGDLDKAEQMHLKALEIHGKLGLQAGMANDYGNIGLINLDRGNLDKAEQMHKKSLEIEEKLGRLEGMASELANLGFVYLCRDELDKAEELHRKALDIEEQIGRQMPTRRRETVASKYGNLGLIYAKRGDLDEAERLFRLALGIYEELRGLEGVARTFGNLARICEERQDIEKAKGLLEVARCISSEIGLSTMSASFDKKLRLLTASKEGGR